MWVYKSVSVFLLLTFILILNTSCFDKKIKIGFITHESVKNQKEIKAAYSFLEKNRNYQTEIIDFNGIVQNSHILSHFDLLWIHELNTSHFNDTNTLIQVINILKEYIKDQGNLLLTQNAFRLLPVLGLEKKEPQTRKVDVKDQGYGRKRGFHAFRSHPIFNHMHGGAYVFNPPRDTVITQVGYFNPGEIIQGKTAAVDWAYISLKENKKLVLEYSHKKGTVMAIGAYMHFSLPNNHRDHFEHFFHNVIDYVTGTNNQKAYYWKYGDKTIQPFTPHTESIKFPDPLVWEQKKSEIGLKREKASDNFWDMAGQRLVIMGKEKGGIEEIWTHPFMALRDYEVGYRFESHDKIQWLHDAKPEISIEPHAFTRTYTLENGSLTEIITTDITKPVGVIHYEYTGREAVQLYLRFKSNIRYMWPYSSRVLGGLKFAWNRQGNNFIIKYTSGDFSSFIGTNKKPDRQLIGQYDSVYVNNDTLIGLAGSSFQVYALSELSLSEGNSFDVVITSSNQGMKKNQLYFSQAIKNPYSVYIHSFNYYQDLLKQKLRITTPDKDFNQGFKWALVGTDKFFVHTPGIGKSLVAGYATTAKGWDGGHEVNGRPGYAWYFGRDGQWSGFAVNDYGDFSKVKEILIQYLEFQDISGKIYHELTTSGVVHYDAADATPLFVILAGEYLHNSGDKNFILKNWGKIQKAINYCYTTDTDNDNLIENRNVGHGWVEGGHLFGGKSTLYLSSCWAAALDQASYMARVLGKTHKSQQYKRDHDEVVDIINRKFWNDNTNYFNHSINEDGSFITDATVLPAIPLYFQQIQDYQKSQSVLDRLAGNNFSSNWGVRIVSESSEYFNPRGYHTGSVWPLFTGWTALAEYKNYKPVQGFTHLMHNLLVYKNWSLGFIEEVLHGAEYKPSGVCSHQCWSETMVLQPVMEGMLGIHPSAPENTLLFSPALPFNWNKVKVNNIRIGNSFLHFNLIKTDKRILYQFQKIGQNKLRVTFKPVLPPATRIQSVTLNGEKREYTLDKPTGLIIPKIDFIIQDSLYIEIKYQGGVFVIPDIKVLEPGESAEGLKIISEDFINNRYKITLEAPSGTSYPLKVFLKNINPQKIINAVFKEKNINTYTLQVHFEKISTRYVKKEVVVEW